MPTPLQSLPSAGTITEATDIAYLQQPSQTVKDTKATLAQILAGPYAAITTAIGTALLKSNNLSDIVSATAARSNLGLGSAATQASSAFDAAGAATAETIRAEAAEAALLAGVNSSDTYAASGRLVDISVTTTYVALTNSFFFRVTQLQTKVFYFSARFNFASGSGCTVGHVPGWGFATPGAPTPAESAFFAAITAYGSTFEISSNAQGAATPQHMTVEPSVSVYGFSGILFRNVPTTAFASTDPALQSATISGMLIFP